MALTTRLALATAAAIGLAACTEAPPTAPTPDGPQASHVASCPTTSPAQQISALITRVRNSSLPQDVKTRIISGLQNAQAALQAGNRTAAISRLQALSTFIENNPRISNTLEHELVTRINCIITALQRAVA